MGKFNPLLDKEVLRLRLEMIERVKYLENEKYSGMITPAERMEYEELFINPLYLSAYKTPKELRSHLRYLLEEDVDRYKGFILVCLKYELYEYVVVAENIIEEIKIDKLIQDENI